jgi:hypothetical protein
MLNVFYVILRNGYYVDFDGRVHASKWDAHPMPKAHACATAYQYDGRVIRETVLFRDEDDFDAEGD